MPIPLKQRKQMSEDPFMKTCIHKRFYGHVCSGRLSWEHSTLYGGRKIQDSWAIVPCCMGTNVDATGPAKRFNKYIALLRASPEDLAKYPKKDWAQEKERFVEEFGIMTLDT